MSYTLNEAAKAAGKSKTTIHRALKSGKISARKLDSGAYAIDPSELHRVFPPVPKEQPKDTSWNGDETLRHQLKNLNDERQREREQMQEIIADLRHDRDKWRQQATALLEDKRPKGFWSKLIGR
jgi:hypothetical protein